jgi:methionyl-tRNA formyltransferase
VAPPAKQVAERLGIPVLQPDLLEAGLDLDAPTVVVCAYGLLVPAPLLAERAWLNVHPSLLPRWRGAAPVERAILAGDTETGVCVMQIERGLDTGPVYARTVTPIGETETAGELRRRLVELGTGLLVDTVPRIGALAPEPQTGEPTHADKLTTEEFELDLARPADELVRVVRAGNPRPGAWTTVDGHRLKVWRARVDDGAFVPVEVQPEGRARMAFDAFVRGQRHSTRLGS